MEGKVIQNESLQSDKPLSRIIKSGFLEKRSKYLKIWKK